MPGLVAAPNPSTPSTPEGPRQKEFDDLEQALADALKNAEDMKKKLDSSLPLSSTSGLPADSASAAALLRAELGETVDRLKGEARHLAAEKADLEDKTENLAAAKGALEEQLKGEKEKLMGEKEAHAALAATLEATKTSLKEVELHLKHANDKAGALEAELAQAAQQLSELAQAEQQLLVYAALSYYCMRPQAPV